MLSLPSAVRVFLAVEHVDMRGSFDSLAGVARRLGRQPEDGHLYQFFTWLRAALKLLVFDGSAWCIFAHLLEQGSFPIPVAV
jgi:transposase